MLKSLVTCDQRKHLDDPFLGPFRTREVKEGKKIFGTYRKNAVAIQLDSRPALSAEPIMDNPTAKVVWSIRATMSTAAHAQKIFKKLV